LAYLHRQNILHCDIKAANLLLFNDDTDVTDDTRRYCIKIADFSLSRKIGYRNKLHVCTHNHRPPEYWEDKPPDPGHWIDIWALGCTVYYLIRGDLLFPSHKPDMAIDRKTHYQQIYNDWQQDHKSLKTPVNLIERLMLLMLNPRHQERPTAESLLTMIRIHTGGTIVRKMYTSIMSLVPSNCPTLDSRITKIGAKLGLEMDLNIKKIAGQILKTVENLIYLDSELYLLTAIWMSSKIVWDRPYNLKILGQPIDLILAAEQKICKISKFKFTIL